MQILFSTMIIKKIILINNFFKKIFIHTTKYQNLSRIEYDRYYMYISILWQIQTIVYYDSS